MKERARRLRKNPTPAEQELWERLRSRKLCDYKFRRQHIIGIYIADFYCNEAELVIEIDGPSHLERKEYDRIRDQRLENRGLTVLRFTNAEVQDDISSVLQRIREHLLDEDG